ncbi:MAG: hypothetical protein D6808_04920 [Candidatus Dadabacteria bacterium]|nr:MAG: hypothetical protein D6808_04920 [Candidatus Dadabacteria bacterium]
MENPKPLLDAIRETGKKPVFVPFYSSSQEKVCAELLEAELFGSEPNVCSRYFSKNTFKEECVKLDIPTVEGVSQSLDSPSDLESLESLVSSLLSHYDSVIIRGEHGSAGSSVYKTDSPDIIHIYEEIKESKQSKVLVEPMLKVIASPNDQWAIDRSGDIHHLGMSAQLFEGLKHAGNLKGQYFSGRTYRTIQKMSRTIAKKMAGDGYVGVFGIDYIITQEGIFPIENNARINGSTFTFGIVDAIEEKIGKVPCWKFFKVHSEARSFEELKGTMRDLLYDGTKINVVFPYDCDTLSETGTFAVVLLAEDMYHIEYLEEGLKSMGIRRV